MRKINIMDGEKLGRGGKLMQLFDQINELFLKKSEIISDLDRYMSLNPRAQSVNQLLKLAELKDLFEKSETAGKVVEPLKDIQNEEYKKIVDEASKTAKFGASVKQEYQILNRLAKMTDATKRNKFTKAQLITHIMQYQNYYLSPFIEKTDSEVTNDIRTLLKFKGSQESKYIMQQISNLPSFRQNMQMHISNLKGYYLKNEMKSKKEKEFLRKLSELNNPENKDRIDTNEKLLAYLESNRKRILELNTDNDPNAMAKFTAELQNFMKSFEEKGGMPDPTLYDWMKKNEDIRKAMLYEYEKKYLGDDMYWFDKNEMRQYLPQHAYKNFVDMQEVRKDHGHHQLPGLLRLVSSPQTDRQKWELFLKDFLPNLEKDDHELIELFGDRRIAAFLKKNKGLKGNWQEWKKKLESIYYTFLSPQYQSRIISEARQKLITAFTKRIEELKGEIKNYYEDLKKTMQKRVLHLFDDVKKNIVDLDKQCNKRIKFIESAINNHVNSIVSQATSLISVFQEEFMDRNQKLETRSKELAQNIDVLYDNIDRFYENHNPEEEARNIDNLQRNQNAWEAHMKAFVNGIDGNMDRLIRANPKAIDNIHDRFVEIRNTVEKALNLKIKNYAGLAVKVGKPGITECLKHEAGLSQLIQEISTLLMAMDRWGVPISHQERQLLKNIAAVETADSNYLDSLIKECEQLNGNMQTENKVRAA